MTSTQPESAAADRAQTFIDWTRINAKALTTGAAIVVVAAAGYWFYVRSKQIQAANAERALHAGQAVDDGREHAAGAERPAEGLLAVRSRRRPGSRPRCCWRRSTSMPASTRTGSRRSRRSPGRARRRATQSTIKSLEGDGYAQMGKMTEAAKAYERRGRRDATFENEKAFQACQGGAGISGGWRHARRREASGRSLLNDPKAQTMAAEARVRLGELNAQPAKR